MFGKIHDYFEQLPSAFVAFVSLVIILCLGFIDYSIGPEISFSVFYILPILISTWYANKLTGITTSIMSAIVWYVAEASGDSQYSHVLVPVWNTGVRLSFFVLFTVLISIIKDKLMLEESLADTDVLTGLANRRFFMERVDLERVRSLRYKETFTIAYIDVDNFKHINDTQGHEVGDEVLVHVSQTLLEHIRKSDLVARLGGDEFAIIFPQLDNEQAKVTLQKMHDCLTESVNNKNWPISFSIGAVTFSKPMTTSREMIKVVDDLMYDVKRAGKNNVAFNNWPSKSIA